MLPHYNSEAKSGSAPAKRQPLGGEFSLGFGMATVAWRNSGCPPSYAGEVIVDKNSLGGYDYPNKTFKGGTQSQRMLKTQAKALDQPQRLPLQRCHWGSSDHRSKGQKALALLVGSLRACLFVSLLLPFPWFLWLVVALLDVSACFATPAARTCCSCLKFPPGL